MDQLSCLSFLTPTIIVTYCSGGTCVMRSLAEATNNLGDRIRQLLSAAVWSAARIPGFGLLDCIGYKRIKPMRESTNFAHGNLARKCFR